MWFDYGIKQIPMRNIMPTTRGQDLLAWRKGQDWNDRTHAADIVWTVGRPCKLEALAELGLSGKR